MLEKFGDIIGEISSIVWGWPLLIFLVGAHIYLTIRLGFIQKYVFKGIKLSFQKDKEAKGDVSQFASLMTALSATLGTGNIIGVATAVLIGGPGAVFWLWIVGLFAIATKYAEGLLAVKYRVKTNSGTMLGGPMYALESGLNMKWLAIIFSVMCSLAAFGIGNGVQANSIAGIVGGHFSEDAANTVNIVVGIALFIATFAVVIGGLKSIARFAEKVIPASAILFMACVMAILVMNVSFIPEAIVLIFKSAFAEQAIAGGAIGGGIMIAMRLGISRGLFSNEAGLGSAPLAAANAVTRNPVRQALVSMSAVFWDTIVMCFLTGVMYTTVILKYPEKFVGTLEDGSTGFVASATDLARGAFETIPGIGAYLITICIILFAWTTILGWCFYGERTMEYLFGKVALIPYRIAFCIVAFIGATIPLGIVWDIADILNALMAVPNVIALVLLSSVLVKETKKYLWSDNLDLASDDVIREVNK